MENFNLGNFLGNLGGALIGALGGAGGGGVTGGSAPAVTPAPPAPADNGMGGMMPMLLLGAVALLALRK